MENFILAKTKSLLAQMMDKGILIAAWCYNMADSSMEIFFSVILSELFLWVLSLSLSFFFAFLYGS